jgi:hypothetical protein
MSPTDGGLADQLAALRAEVERLRTHEEIRRLVYRYALAEDARDTDTITTLFSDEADFGPAHGTGAQGARSFYDSNLSGIALGILNVGNILIELDDVDRAHGVVYCHGQHQLGDQWIVQQMMYRDRYVRQRREWRFRSRQHLLFYGGEMFTRPTDLPAAEPGEMLTGRGRAPEIWPTYRAFWNRHPVSGQEPPAGQ